MLSKTYSFQLAGLLSELITIEVDLTRGRPQLIIIGLAAKEISESKERITSALINCGVTPKAKKTIVNLAPAGVKKSGSKFDLAIIVAILQAYKLLPVQDKPTAFFGEIALDGKVRKTAGIFPLALAAKKQGFKQIVVPKKNEFETHFIEGLKVFAISHISELLKVKKVSNLPPTKIQQVTIAPASQSLVSIDTIYGQQQAKRALEISAAGGHNLHFSGPPGSGKSMLAQAIVSILPNLKKQEILEVNCIHSAAGKIEKQLLLSPPIRAPHPSITQTALLGGGQNVRPGEISLAHKGVLFLDEINEYSRNVLEALRIPLENKSICISRQKGSVVYPADAIFLCASNPCPCGYFQSRIKPCRCSKTILNNYQNKLSGPLLDRIDLHVFVTPIKADSIWKSPKNTQQHQTKLNVARAREIQKKRYKKTPFQLNASVSSQSLKEIIQVNTETKEFLQRASIRYALSTRSYFKVLKVARTIADLANSKKVNIQHIAEALQFRPKTKKLQL